MSVVEFRRPNKAHDLVEQTPASALVDETDGAIFVEYLTLTVLVAILCATATLTLGAPLLRLFRFQQAVVAIPIP